MRACETAVAIRGYRYMGRLGSISTREKLEYQKLLDSTIECWQKMKELDPTSRAMRAPLGQNPGTTDVELHTAGTLRAYLVRLCRVLEHFQWSEEFIREGFPLVLAYRNYLEIRTPRTFEERVAQIDGPQRDYLAGLKRQREALEWMLSRGRFQDIKRKLKVAEREDSIPLPAI